MPFGGRLLARRVSRSADTASSGTHVPRGPRADAKPTMETVATWHPDVRDEPT